MNAEIKRSRSSEEIAKTLDKLRSMQIRATLFRIEINTADPTCLKRALMEAVKGFVIVGDISVEHRNPQQVLSLTLLYVGPHKGEPADDQAIEGMLARRLHKFFAGRVENAWAVSGYHFWTDQESQVPSFLVPAGGNISSAVASGKGTAA